MLGHLCSRLECHLGGKVQEIAQERKDGNVRVVRNARPDRNEWHFARKMEKIGKFCPEELSVWLPWTAGGTHIFCWWRAERQLWGSALISHHEC